uniref:Uncharacterized protein n=1 Tax=Arundo donax TaxID=35708 RepID=A0A0A8YIK1_ARUDO
MELRDRRACSAWHGYRILGDVLGDAAYWGCA